MRSRDTEPAMTGAIIPFAPRICEEESGPTVSTIVAVMAVTLLHDKDECAEDRLAQLIERSGEAEIVEMSEAFDEGLDLSAATSLPKVPAFTNDNMPQ